MICACWISQWNDGPGSREAAMDPNVALFRSPDRCFAALAAWHARDLDLFGIPLCRAGL